MMSLTFGLFTQVTGERFRPLWPSCLVSWWEWNCVFTDVFSFADDKAPEDLIPQMQALNLLETKTIFST